MIFLAVGTLFPFDRLVKAVDEAVSGGIIEEPVFAQIGRGGYKPVSMEYAEELNKETFDSYVKTATFIISHSGMGIISAALSNNKRLLVMPRRKQYGEHVNDHQVGTAKKFSELKHILAAYDTLDLPERISQLKTFVPKERKANPEAVAGRIRDFIKNLQK